MLGKIKDFTYSISRKSVTDDGKQKGQYSKSPKRDSKDHQEEEETSPALNLYQITFEELTELTQQLEQLDIYKEKGFTFECKKGYSSPTVIVKDPNGKILQELYPFQVKQILKNFSQDDAPKTGSILNIAC